MIALYRKTCESVVVCVIHFVHITLSSTRSGQKLLISKHSCWCTKYFTSIVCLINCSNYKKKSLFNLVSSPEKKCDFKCTTPEIFMIIYLSVWAKDTTWSLNIVALSCKLELIIRLPKAEYKSYVWKITM